MAVLLRVVMEVRPPVPSSFITALHGPMPAGWPGEGDARGWREEERPGM